MALGSFKFAMPSDFDGELQGAGWLTPLSVLKCFFTYYGYMVAGYYVNRFGLSRKEVVRLMVTAMIAFGGMFALHSGLDRTIGYLSIPLVCITICVFYFFKRAFEHLSFTEKQERVFCTLGSYTFGIYLMHWLLLELLYIHFPVMTSVNNLITSLIVFTLGTTLVHIISKFKFKKYIVG